MLLSRRVWKIYIKTEITLDNTRIKITLRSVEYKYVTNLDTKAGIRWREFNVRLMLGLLMFVLIMQL